MKERTWDTCRGRLALHVLQSNHRAIRLYEKNGLKVVEKWATTTDKLLCYATDHAHAPQLRCDSDSDRERRRRLQALGLWHTLIRAIAARKDDLIVLSGTAATQLRLVTHALTLRGGQLTWAVLHSFKCVENRDFRMGRGWYALHTGAKTESHASQLPLLAQLPGVPDEGLLPHSTIVGAIHISHALTLEQCTDEPWAFGPCGHGASHRQRPRQAESWPAAERADACQNPPGAAQDIVRNIRM